MSDYGNYSSDDGSDDDIGLPKTPGAPLNANHSDSDENDSSQGPNDQNNSDYSDSGSDREPSMQQQQQQLSNQVVDDDDDDDEDDDDDDNSSQHQKSSSNENSWDGQQRKQPQNDSASSSDQDSDGENENRKEQSRNEQRDSGDDDSEDEDQAESSQSNSNKRKQISDSESESDSSEKIAKKRKALKDSSEDSNYSMIKEPKPEDLFGELSDEDDINNGGDVNKDQSDEEVNHHNNNRKNNDDDDENDDDDDDEDGGNNYLGKEIDEIFGANDDEQENLGMDEEDGQIPETRIEVEIPRITANLGDNIHFVKLPNFLSIDTHPYDPQWYEDEIDEDEVHDDEGRARLKLKVENTIRWRNVIAEDGSMQKESNARVVKWTDGSMSLHLGDEIFDIQTFNLLPGENNHLFIRQGTGLQGQSVFKTKLIFRPFSTESFTHRKLTLSLADRSQKTQKICVIPNVGKDPEAHRSEMIKKEEVKLKQSIRKENKPKRMRDRSFNRGSHSGYDLDDEDDESISIAKIKNQYKRGSNYPNSQYDGEDEDSENGDEDDDDSDLDIFEKKKIGDKKKIVDSDDEDDEEDDDDDDD